MYVGVILASLTSALLTVSIPHVCGGDPVVVYARKLAEAYSPCMWG